jgi:hypothetical protein
MTSGYFNSLRSMPEQYLALKVSKRVKLTSGQLCRVILVKEVRQALFFYKTQPLVA